MKCIQIPSLFLVSFKDIFSSQAKPNLIENQLPPIQYILFWFLFCFIFFFLSGAFHLNLVFCVNQLQHHYVNIFSFFLSI